MNREALLIIMVIAVAISSTLIHMPLDVQEAVFGAKLFSPVYSDIFGYYSSYYSSANSSLPIPYRDFDYYQMPLSGLMLLVPAAATYVVAGGFFGAGSETVFYLVFSALNTLFYIFIILYYVRLTRFITADRRSTLLLFYPSFIVYLVYDWSIVALFLIIAGIYYVVTARPFIGYSLLAMSSLIQPIMFLALLGLLYLLFQEDRSDDIKGMLFGLALTLLIVILWLIGLPYSTRDLVGLITGYSCRNCLYILVFKSPSNPLVLPISLSVAYALSFIILLLKSRWQMGYLWKPLLLFISLIVFGIDFVPQYILFILPLLPLLSEGVTNRWRILFLLLIADILNVLVIILWFSDASLRASMGIPGIPIRNNPWELASPIQWIAQSRNIILGLILISIYLDKLYLEE